MVPALPTFVHKTHIKIYGIGLSLSRSQTWKIKVEMKIIEVTSSISPKEFIDRARALGYNDASIKIVIRKIYDNLLSTDAYSQGYCSSSNK